jgi:hypothetical protein
MLDQEIIRDNPFPNKMIINLEMWNTGMEAREIAEIF